jgi:hypothetical protein
MNLPNNYDTWRLASPEEPKELTCHQKESLIEAAIELYKDNYFTDEGEFCGMTWYECAREVCGKYDVEHEAEMIAGLAETEYKRGEGWKT